MKINTLFPARNNNYIFQKKSQSKKNTIFGKIKTEPQIQELPKLSILKLIFARLTNEEIQKINQAGYLPTGARFIKDGEHYKICNDFFKKNPKERIIPENYELKNDILGYTHVVPKNHENPYLK